MRRTVGERWENKKFVSTKEVHEKLFLDRFWFHFSRRNEDRKTGKFLSQFFIFRADGEAAIDLLLRMETLFAQKRINQAGWDNALWSTWVWRLQSTLVVGGCGTFFAGMTYLMSCLRRSDFAFLSRTSPNGRIIVSNYNSVFRSLASTIFHLAFWLILEENRRTKTSSSIFCSPFLSPLTRNDKCLCSFGRGERRINVNPRLTIYFFPFLRAILREKLWEK